MKNQILNIGEALTKAEQKTILGGDINVPELVDPGTPYPLDKYGRECRYPFYVNKSGRCTL